MEMEKNCPVCGPAQKSRVALKRDCPIHRADHRHHDPGAVSLAHAMLVGIRDLQRNLTRFGEKHEHPYCLAEIFEKLCRTVSDAVSERG